VNEKGEAIMAKQAVVVGSRAPQFSLPCTSGQESARRLVSGRVRRVDWMLLEFFVGRGRTYGPSARVAMAKSHISVCGKK
jgi:hypothetical protein